MTAHSIPNSHASDPMTHHYRPSALNRSMTVYSIPNPPTSDPMTPKDLKLETKSIPRKTSRGSSQNQKPNSTYRKYREMCSFWPPQNLGSSSDKVGTRYEISFCWLWLVVSCFLWKVFADKLVFLTLGVRCGSTPSSKMMAYYGILMQ